MKGFHLLLFLLPLVLLPLSGRPAVRALAPTATQVQLEISAPAGGEALQGQVMITGTTDVPGFRSAEVVFAYQSDPTGTWFLLQQINTPVMEGMLSTWDTTMITDGVYQLRLQVFLKDGQVLERTVSGLRVRNYTTVETSTPVLLPPGQPTPTRTSTPRADFQPQLPEETPLPTNPAQVTTQHLGISAVRGALFIFGAALLGFVYMGLRALTRR